ncbi:MAG: hypothetical protein Q8Q09_10615, partial [Deltaproteobacteria bacterium]|nr:hypothetical protein [Deltaproteobacteria bacterium]
GPSQAFVTLGFRTEPGAWIGGSVTTGLDLNGDGIADSVVYMGLRVILFGSLDRRFTYANAWTREFGDIVALADLDGDGITEFAGSAEGGPGEPSYQKVCSGRFLLGDRFARCVPVGSRNAAWLAPLLGLPGGRAVVFVESELDNEFHSMAQPCEITGWTVRCLRPVRWLSVNHGDGDHLLGCHAGVITDQCEGHSPESIRPDRWW